MKMRDRIVTAVCIPMAIIPWTILILRQHAWALESPTGEIIIFSYAAFMVISGIFTTICYSKGKVKNTAMRLCAVVNVIYAIAAVCIVGWSVYSMFVK